MKFRGRGFGFVPQWYMHGNNENLTKNFGKRDFSAKRGYPRVCLGYPLWSLTDGVFCPYTSLVVTMRESPLEVLEPPKMVTTARYRVPEVP